MLSLTSLETAQTTAITDLLIFVLLLIYLSWIQTSNPLKSGRSFIWSGIFILVALGSGLGAVVHGVVLSEAMVKWLWWSIYLLLDLSIALFAIAVIYDWLGKKAAKDAVWVIAPIVVLCFILLLIYDSFLLFISYQIIVMLSALVIYGWLSINKTLPGAVWICVGILLMILGAVFQSMDFIKFSLIWTFNHNGLYHLLSLVGMSSIFIGLRRDFKTF